MDIKRSPTSSEVSDELCKVCGDKAIGYNFQVVSCDSCRSFFRRCSNEKTMPECPFNGTCNITIKTRKFCRACRLNKCYQEGMKHETSKTLDSTQQNNPKTPKVKRIKSEVPAKRPKTKCSCKCQCGFYSPDTELIAASSNLTQQNSPLITYGNPSSSSTIQTFSPINSSFSPLIEQKELNKFAMLNVDDQFLLNELISANSVLKAPMELTLKELDTSSSEISLLSVVKISDLAMRRIISMAKQLTGFQKIHPNDQISLMKGGLSELLILRGLMCFDVTHNTWAHQIFKGTRHISLHVDVLKKTPEEQHYEIHRNFLHTFDERWRQNETVMLILNAIVLFSFDRQNIQNVALVRQTQQLYIDLLERYLQTECQMSEALHVYKTLMKQLLKLREVNQSLQQVYNKMPPDYLEPLLKELFAHTQT